MRQENYSSKELKTFLKNNKIATLDELKEALGTNVSQTVFRKLKELGYQTSYSHNGKFYALSKNIRFNEQGLWSFKSVRFSIHGTLLETTYAFINQSEAGCSARELKDLLGVEVKGPLAKLAKTQRLSREKFVGNYIYFSSDSKIRKKQVLCRKKQAGLLQTDIKGLEKASLSNQIYAAIILFFSSLNEKQRRLYAGLESLRLGRGGDSHIAKILGLEVHTISKGRAELMNRDFETGRVRKKGGGRLSIKKNSRK